MTRRLATRTATPVAALPVDGWRRPGRCGPNGGNCVEVNVTADVVGVRDSKPATSPVLMFDPTAWRSFVGTATQAKLPA